MASGDIEIGVLHETAQDMQPDAKTVAFLRDRTPSTMQRVETAKERYMEGATRQTAPWDRHSVGLFSSPLRSLKTVILIPLVLVRIAGLFVCLIVAVILVTIATKIACLPPLSPKPTDLTPGKIPCRSWIFIYAAQPFMRLALFFLGYQWVTWTGRPAPKTSAPVITPNHISWVETFYLVIALLCSGMAKGDTGKQAVVGNVIQALQFVLVDRDDPESRKLSAQAMEVRVNTPDFPQFMIFPEGAISNGKQLIQFKDGPFRLGVPVQPVHISYPFEKWCSGYDPTLPLDYRKTGLHVLRAFFEFHNPMHVHWLDPYIPSEEEKADSLLYARNVRAYMSAKTGLPCTEHTLDDSRLMLFAKQELNISGVRWVAIETGKMKKDLHFTYDDAKNILERFEHVDHDKTGKVDMNQFLNALGLPRTPLTEKLFEVYDLNGDGEVNFREYLCAQAILRGISKDQHHEGEASVIGSPLHPESIDFAWHVLVGGKSDKTIKYDDIKGVFERYAMPTGDGAMVRRLFDKAKGEKPAMDRVAFNSLMQAAPEYMELVRLGEKQRMGSTPQ